MSWIRLPGSLRLPLLLSRSIAFRLLSEHATTVSFHRQGVNWSIFTSPDGIYRDLFVRGEYQAAEREGVAAFLTAHRPASQVVIDVGANIGTPAIEMAREHGFFVVAVEPVSDTFDLLTRNVDRNFLGDRIHCMNLAISNKYAEVDIVVHPKRAHSEVLEPGGDLSEITPSGERVQVPALSLESLVETVDVSPESVALVWSDTEGYELEILESGPTLWETGVPLYVELSQKIERHGGLSAFVEAVKRWFEAVVPKDQLVSRERCWSPLPISALPDLIPKGREFTDVLLLP